MMWQDQPLKPNARLASSMALQLSMYVRLLPPGPGRRVRLSLPSFWCRNAFTVASCSVPKGTFPNREALLLLFEVKPASSSLAMSDATMCFISSLMAATDGASPAAPAAAVASRLTSYSPSSRRFIVEQVADAFSLRNAVPNGNFSLSNCQSAVEQNFELGGVNIHQKQHIL